MNKFGDLSMYDFDLPIKRLSPPDLDSDYENNIQLDGINTTLKILELYTYIIINLIILRYISNWIVEFLSFKH